MSTAVAPPQNLEAEESVLGAMMLGSERTIDTIAEILRPTDFYRESYGAIFSTALDLHEEGKPVTTVSMADRMTQMNLIGKIGGEAKLIELAALVPAASNADHYARIVADNSARRALITAGQEIVRAVIAGGEVADLKLAAENYLAGVEHYGFVEQAKGVTEGLSELLAEIRSAYETRVPIMGLRTGFDTIDNALGGLWPGQLILLAARPGMGKSTLGLNIAENFADRGDTSLFIALEMSLYELQIKGLARLAEVDSSLIASGMMEMEQAIRLGAAAEKLKTRALTQRIADDGSMNLSALKAETTRLVRTADCKLLIVDYIQLMQGDGKENRTQEIGLISRGLKMLARRLNIPIIALSQMNRSIETRVNKRPVLSDLRESGSLEQDADVVIFLHDDSNYDTDQSPDGTVEVIIEKNRKGKTSTVNMAFNKRWSRFMDMRNMEST